MKLPLNRYWSIATLALLTVQEKNILAAIVAELSEGIIICNPDGQILLRNNRVKDRMRSPIL
jgi:hypothetical protein